MASVSDLVLNETEPFMEASPSPQKSYMHFRRQWVKWLGLFLICIFPFGKSWAYDNPQPLENVLKANMNLSSEQYNILYTGYSIPNYVIPLFSGYLVAKYGIKFGVITFGSFVVLGTLLFCIGCAISEYGLVLAGRLVFGLGGESTLMIKYFMLAAWFQPKELGFATGATFITERLGNTFNSMFTPQIYQATQSLAWTTGVGFIFCLISQICGIIWLFLNQRYAVRRGGNGNKKAARPEFKQILKFKPFTFVYAVVSMIFYGAFISFAANGNAFLQQQYQFTQTQAGDMFSMMYIVAAVSTPIFGKLIDIIGHKIHILILSLVTLAAAMFLFMFLPDCYRCNVGFFPLACMGISLALFSSSFWPPLVQLEKKEYFGLVNGFIHCCYNISVGIYPILVGMIQDDASQDEAYHYVLLLEGVSACAGIGVTLVLEVLNIKEKRGLNKKAGSGESYH